MYNQITNIIPYQILGSEVWPTFYISLTKLQDNHHLTLNTINLFDHYESLNVAPTLIFWYCWHNIIFNIREFLLITARCGKASLKISFVSTTHLLVAHTVICVTFVSQGSHSHFLGLLMSGNCELWIHYILSRVFGRKDGKLQLLCNYLKSNSCMYV
jgi:hypothetical protein